MPPKIKTVKKIVEKVAPIKKEEEKKDHVYHPCDKYDVWNKWTDKSQGVNFATRKKGVGNGEEKLASELDVKTGLGGQNSVVDLKHDILGNITVKDMTDDDCILGADGSEKMRVIFRKIVFPLLTWCEKYKDPSEYKKVSDKSVKYIASVWEQLNKSHGRSRITIYQGIERFELSGSNLQVLNDLIADVIATMTSSKCEATESEYFKDICKNIKGGSLITLLNECVREEATKYTLVIVSKTKGWLIAKDLTKITCPRITRGSPRINYTGR